MVRPGILGKEARPRNKAGVVFSILMPLLAVILLAVPAFQGIGDSEGGPALLGLRGPWNTAQLEVDYRAWGRLDSSLRFTQLQTPYSNQPVLQPETISLVRFDTYFDLGDDGQWQVKAILEWRIKTAPTSPHVDAAAAIRYVRVEIARSKDPIVNMNSQKARPLSLAKRAKL